MTSGHIWHFLHQLRGLLGPADSVAESDGELLDRFARLRDEDAFVRLMDRHGSMVLSVCRRVLRQTQDAEDAFQAAFLVLARRAGTIRKQESVGSWLYATAYRMALNVRESAVRRRAHESPLDPPDSSSSPLTEGPAVPSSEASDLERQELRAVLDEELHRLPEKYRAPMVLCYLEGKTNEQAAEELAWTKGTVSGRLARARDLLRDRLSRRGMSLTALTLTAALSEGSSGAAVPARLSSATVRAASLFAAGETVNALPAQVAILAEGALQAMRVSKWKIAAFVVLTVGMLAGGGAAIRAHLQITTLHQPPNANVTSKDGISRLDTGNAVAMINPKHEVESRHGKTDPPGVPLQLRLIAKSDSYQAFDLGGLTREEFEEKVSSEARFEPPAVNFVMELTNTGDQELEVGVGGDPILFSLDLQGPGVIHAAPGVGFTKDIRPPVTTKLAPGAKRQFALTELQYGFRGKTDCLYWTKPGKYTLTASLKTVVAPAPEKAKRCEYDDFTRFGIVTVISNAVVLEVKDSIAEQRRGKTDPLGVPLQLRLIAKSNAYQAVDLGGLTKEEFQKKAASKSNVFAPPAVNFVMELTNTGDRELDVGVGGDPIYFTLDLQGPGAIHVLPDFLFSHDFKPFVTRKLAPGAKHQFALKELQYGFRGIGERLYWTKPGEYTLIASLKTVVAPVPEQAKIDPEEPSYGIVTVTSNAVIVDVTDRRDEDERRRTNKVP